MWKSSSKPNGTRVPLGSAWYTSAGSSSCRPNASRLIDMCSFGVSTTWSAHRPSDRTSSDDGDVGMGMSCSITVTSGRSGPTRHAQYQTFPRFG